MVWNKLWLGKGRSFRMRLETERLVIRSIVPEDTKAFIEMAADGSLEKDIFPGRSGVPEFWMAEWIEEAIRADERENIRDWLAFCVEEKKRGKVVGSVGCSFNPDFGAVGLVYFIGAQDRGNSYAAEAAAVFSKYLLEKYPISRLLTTVRHENFASRKTMEKAGFMHIKSEMYQDYMDDFPGLYHFYERKQS